MNTCDRCLGGTHVRCRGRFDSPCPCNICGHHAPIGRQRRTVTQHATPRRPRNTNGAANAPLDEAGQEQARRMYASGVPVLTIANQLGTSRYNVKKAVR